MQGAVGCSPVRADAANENEMSMSKDELLTLIALANGCRLVELEEEIFADKMLTTAYLKSVTYANEPGIWNETGYTLDESRCLAIYWYARNVIKGRWMIAEPLITLKGIQHYYTKFVVNDKKSKIRDN